MDQRRLQCFIVLAEELNFRRAADRCHISQPGLSQLLRQLEDELQVQLFYRDRRNVSLTPAGELFRKEAYKLLLQMTDIVDRARQIERGAIGELTIGATATALFVILPEITRRFAKALPKVALTIRSMTTADQERALRRGDIQVGLVHPPLEDTALVCRVISAIPFDVVLSDENPLSKKAVLTLKDLAQETFILFPRAVGPRLYDEIIALCHQEGFSPRKIIEAAPAQSIVAMAACNMGIGFVASRLQHYARPLATYRRLRGPGPRLTLGVIRASERISPTVEKFVDIATMVGASLR
ncbi:LysR family transcriptional regulator [Castellaniella sp. S9]|uniref:LysR substrate-binding domain-containing protein n=1 Tax=Castellaniella sp. S9 TaxID=2993652 RepID=UPI0022B45702|nr:LysR family transcriptional regulator [Castellaniella sp. S9]